MGRTGSRPCKRGVRRGGPRAHPGRTHRPVPTLLCRVHRPVDGSVHLGLPASTSARPGPRVSCTPTTRLGDGGDGRPVVKDWDRVGSTSPERSPEWTVREQRRTHTAVKQLQTPQRHPQPNRSRTLWNYRVHPPEDLDPSFGPFPSRLRCPRYLYRPPSPRRSTRPSLPGTPVDGDGMEVPGVRQSLCLGGETFSDPVLFPHLYHLCQETRERGSPPVVHLFLLAKGSELGFKPTDVRPYTASGSPVSSLEGRTSPDVRSSPTGPPVPQCFAVPEWRGTPKIEVPPGPETGPR